MTGFDRTDRSILGLWWWTVDKWTLSALALLLCAGMILIMAASPPVAGRIGAGADHFVLRHLAFMAPALAALFAMSLLPPDGVRHAAAVMLAAALVLLVATPLVAQETKGAQRWIQVAGLSVQASEFVKPALAVTCAWLLARARSNPRFPGHGLSAALVLLTVVLLLWQPDLGMTLVVLAIWCSQLFLAGLPLAVMACLAALCGGLLAASYLHFDYVRNRIDGYLDPGSTDSFQIDTSLRAFEAGGLLGRGPNEGVVKDTLPDAHSDFIFAVAGEEFGLFACLFLVALFVAVGLRGFLRMAQERDLFVLLAVGGLLVQFTVQAVTNMGVTLQLLPATGMTLPFVSYGGSSLLSTACGAGMLLALTRRRPEHGRST